MFRRASLRQWFYLLLILFVVIPFIAAAYFVPPFRWVLLGVSPFVLGGVITLYVRATGRIVFLTLLPPLAMLDGGGFSVFFCSWMFLASVPPLGREMRDNFRLDGVGWLRRFYLVRRLSHGERVRKNALLIALLAFGLPLAGIVVMINASDWLYPTHDWTAWLAVRVAIGLAEMALAFPVACYLARNGGTAGARALWGGLFLFALVPGAAPFAMLAFVLREAVARMPGEMLDAAALEGAGPLRAAFGIALPVIARAD